MARELREIAADPQPYECVRVTPTVVYRVSRRDPILVTYRREAVGEECVERGVSLPEWRDLILLGEPCEPHTFWP
jgi:hypothetical protein